MDVCSAASSRRRAWATRASFLTAGIGLSAWAPLVPYARDRLGASDGQLGLVLLALGLGSIIAMPLAGLVAARIGCRRLIAALTTLSCACLPGLALAPGYATLVPLLALYGAVIGSMDVAINLHAVIVERDAGRPMMSGFHGCFSLGCIVGAGGIAALLSAGAAPWLATLPPLALVLACLAWYARELSPSGGDRGASWSWPHGRLLLLGLTCFATFLTEGAVLDWSAVALAGQQGLANAHAGVGFTVFAIAMTLTRLCGDRLASRLGITPLLLGGTALAVIGLLLTMWAPQAPAALLGYALAGLGAANIAPLVFSAAGRQAGGNTQAAVAAVSTMGYAGSLAGPALIGLVARLSSLPLAITAVAIWLALAVTLGLRSVRHAA